MVISAFWSSLWLLVIGGILSLSVDEDDGEDGSRFLVDFHKKVYSKVNHCIDTYLSLLPWLTIHP